MNFREINLGFIVLKWNRMFWKCQFIIMRCDIGTGFLWKGAKHGRVWFQTSEAKIRILEWDSDLETLNSILLNSFGNSEEFWSRSSLKFLISVSSGGSCHFPSWKKKWEKWFLTIFSGHPTIPIEHFQNPMIDYWSIRAIHNGRIFILFWNVPISRLFKTVLWHSVAG